jgi:hypothetical protein
LLYGAGDMESFVSTFVLLFGRAYYVVKICTNDGLAWYISHIALAVRYFFCFGIVVNPFFYFMEDGGFARKMILFGSFYCIVAEAVYYIGRVFAVLHTHYSWEDFG